MQRSLRIPSTPESLLQQVRHAEPTATIAPDDSRSVESALTDAYLLSYGSQSIATGLSIVMQQPHDVLFRTLADPTRRAIFERLCREGELTVGVLTAGAGISQPAVSKHLGVLKRAGLVRDRHEGRQTHYSAQRQALGPLADWTSEMGGFWRNRFDDLEDLLNRMDQ